MRQIWLLHSRRFIFEIIASPTAAIWKISSNEKMSYIQETTLTTKILPKVLHKCFGSTTWSIHSISVEHQSKYRMDVKRRVKVWRKMYFKTNLKQSDNILYACFVWSSLLWLGKRVGILERFAYRTAQQKYNTFYTN